MESCKIGAKDDQSEVASMLQVSEAATELLKAMRDGYGLSEDSGVRLEPSKDESDALSIAFREDPELGDEVIEESGLRVFVPEEVADHLGDRTLDLETTPQGVALALRLRLQETR